MHADDAEGSDLHLHYASGVAARGPALERTVTATCAVLAVAAGTSLVLMLAQVCWHDGLTLARRTWFAQAIDFSMLTREPRGWWRSEWLGTVGLGIASWLRSTAILPLAFAATFGSRRHLAWPRWAACVGVALFAASDALVHTAQFLASLSRWTNLQNAHFEIGLAAYGAVRALALPVVFVPVAFSRRREVRRRWLGATMIALAIASLSTRVGRTDRAVFDMMIAHSMMHPILQLEGRAGGALDPLGSDAAEVATTMTSVALLVAGVGSVIAVSWWRRAVRVAAASFAAWQGLALFATLALLGYHFATIWTDDYTWLGYDDRDGPLARTLGPIGRLCFCGLAATIARDDGTDSPRTH